MTPASRRADVAAWRDEIAHAVAQLPDFESTVLRLVYVEGLTHRQVSRRLAIPTKVVDTHVARGMRELGELLDAATRA